MKVLLKIVVGLLAIGGFTYWLVSIFFRPAKKWKKRRDSRKQNGFELDLSEEDRQDGDA